MNGRLVALILAGYPIAWAMGLGPVVFPLAAVLMALWLIRNRPFLIPPGTIALACFLVIVATSLIEVNSIGRLGVWVLRTSWYASALILWLFLARQDTARARRCIIYALMGIWAMAILGGWAAVLTPDLSWRTPVASLLPEVIAGDEYVSDLINPRVSETQLFFPDIQLNRPAAPFAYTNAWGSNVALLTPFIFIGFQERRLRIPRWILIGALFLGLVPFYFSLNRGAWLTLGIGLIYGLTRFALLKRRILPIAVLAGIAGIALVVATSTGILGAATGQLETRTGDSNETRASLYVETIQRSAESPMIGYGTPRASISNPTGPPLGTHGQLWAILFAHGYIAAFLYVGFFLLAFFRARGRDPVTHWAKVSLAIGLMQLPIYGHLPMQLFVMVVAAAVAIWPARALYEPQPEALEAF